jgi:hypothetical protein
MTEEQNAETRIESFAKELDAVLLRDEKSGMCIPGCASWLTASRPCPFLRDR